MEFDDWMEEALKRYKELQEAKKLEKMDQTGGLQVIDKSQQDG